MEQVNGSHFKLVYPYWYRNKGMHFPFPNGLLPSTITWMTEMLNHINSPIALDDLDRAMCLLPFYNDTDDGYLFRHADLYRHAKLTYKHCAVNVEEMDREPPGTKFYYPIEIECGRSRLLIEDHIFSQHNKKEVYRFRNTIPNVILDRIRHGQIKLLISNMVDTAENLEYILELEKEVTLIGIPPENVVLLFGNRDYSYNGNMLQLDSIISLYQTSHTMPLYPFETSLGYVSDYVRTIDIDRTKIRAKKFLSFNRNLSAAHRIAWCVKSIEHNLLSDGYFSFLSNLNDNPGHLERILDIARESLENKISKVKEIIPYEIDTHHVQNKMSFTTNENNKKELYLNSYFHITSETEFAGHRSPFFSEKTWRPILNLQPFLFFGNAYSLEALHDMGFFTFEPFIDESYDRELDIRKRFAKVVEQVVKLQNLSHEQLHALYFEMFDRIQHNQETLAKKVGYNPISKLIEG